MNLLEYSYLDNNSPKLIKNFRHYMDLASSCIYSVLSKDDLKNLIYENELKRTVKSLKKRGGVLIIAMADHCNGWQQGERGLCLQVHGLH